MGTRVSDVMIGSLGQLRYEPTEKRIRATIDDMAVVDSARALLVWEPRRVVPSYAVPIGDVQGELIPAPAAPTSDALILHPGIPFPAHSCPGAPLSIAVAGERGVGAAFRPDDPDLAGRVILDFQSFDGWQEEDEVILGHPRDPFHRVDIRRSSRHVRVELEGELLAESARPRLVFETHLPLRFYVPPEDVRVGLRPGALSTRCAYKGQASYWSVDVGSGLGDDLAWSYEDPLPDAAELSGLVAFFDDRVDVVVDGVPRPRPDTAIAQALVDELGTPTPERLSARRR